MKPLLTTKNNKRGYTLLFSVLLTSLILAVGLSILSITRKELILSSAGHESQAALYAADAGADCALFFDALGSNGNDFSTTTLSTINPPGVKCNKESNVNATTTPVVDPFPEPNYLPTTFSFNFKLGDGANTNPCAYVTVRKEYVGSVLTTTIESRGYNTCDVTNPRRTERAIRVSY